MTHTAEPASVVQARTSSEISGAGSRRLDVQGLRALAVAAVVLFHAGIPMPGGFVGVDVFFVISGYVITAMLLREHQRQGRLRLGRFYLRRFKRLTPALALMVSVTLLMSVLLLSPFGPQTMTAKTGVGAMALLANIAIPWAGGGQYFGPDAETNALLHTWSLSVEEQFYLIFPILMATALASRARAGRRVVAFCLVSIMALGSIMLVAANTLGVSFFGDAVILGFYSPFARVWEFAAGAILAIVPHAHWIRRQSSAAALGVIGLALLVMSFFAVDETRTWPGPWTTLPVVATMLLIVAGSNKASATNFVTRLLSAKPLVKTGDWSYSLYLWHWPPIVFAHFMWPGQAWAPLLAAAVSVVPALMSYRFVEEPIRNSQALVGGKLVRAVAIIVLVPIAISGAVYLGSKELWGSTAAETMAAEVVPAHLGASVCDQRDALGSQPSECLWNSEEKGKAIYLLGDSNMAHFTEGFVEAGRSLGRPVLASTTNACPFLDIAIRDSRLNPAMDARCRAYVQDTIEWLQGAPAATVVIANTDRYAMSDEVSFGLTSGELSAEPDYKAMAMSRGLTSVVSRIQEMGHEVLIIHGIPLWIEGNAWDPSTCTNLTVISGGCSAMMTIGEATERQGDWREVRSLVAMETGARLWDPWPSLCAGDTCATHERGRVMYRDEGHITVGQSERFRLDFVAILSVP